MVTDIDILVKLGYSRELSRKALAETKGDRSAALEYIRTGGLQSDKEWSTFRPESDWKNNIAARDLPRSSQMRALWKSPVTAHVNSFYRMDDGTFRFRCHVITHKADWQCSRTLDQFLSFKSSLALGTTLWFKSPFPSPWTQGVSSLLSLLGAGEGEVERRRRMLDDWVRELTLSEQCMSDDAVLQSTLSFFRGEEGGDDTPSACPYPFPSSSSPFPPSQGVKGAAGLYDTDSTCPPPLVDVLRRIRTLKRDCFPVTVSALDGMLTQGPFKILVSDFPSLLSTPLRDDTQLEKDLVRDRLVVNSKRHQGSSHSSSSFLDTVLSSCQDSVMEVLSSPQLSPLSRGVPPSSVEGFCRGALSGMSRTESAYLSLLSLNSIVDLSPSQGEGQGEMDMGMPGLIVPESVLADPILLSFKLLERKPPAPSHPSSSSAPSQREYCVDCQGETSTVYRVCDGDTMATQLQVRVVYSRRTFALVAPSGLEERQGPSHLLFLRETTTTARDWR